MQGCIKYHDGGGGGGARFSEGMLIFLGKLEWGCQIFWGTKYIL